MKYFAVLCLILVSTMMFAQWSEPEIDQYKSQYEKRFVQVHRSADDFDVHFYFLDVEMDNMSTQISGSVQIDLSVINPEASNITLDFDDAMTVDAVRVNALTVSYTHSGNIISIPLIGKGLQDISLEIDFQGTPPYGMYNANDPDWNTRTTYSLSEPFDAMGWFPVKQDLTDKADSSWVFVTVPDNLMAGSNGLLDQVVDNGDGTETYQWKSSYPIAYYLISVSIGEYQDVSFYAHPEQTEDSILIQNYIYNASGYLSANEWSMNRTAPIMEVFCDKFGMYPHAEEKYGHCVAKFGGGMEHQTMTTIRDFSFSLVAHELGHSWFGNYITCATWQDIWINEGFAVYSELVADAELRTPAELRDHLENNMISAKMYDDGSVYVPFEEATSVSRIFDYYLTYKKGGMLVHMIRYLIDDDEVFFNVLHEHLAMYGDSVATGEDFRAVLEDVSGLDFETFFDEWYYGEGYPTYSANWYQHDGRVYIETSQTTSAAATPLFTIPLEYRLYFTDGDSLTVQLSQDALIVNHEIDETREVESISLDPDLWVICNTSVQEVVGVENDEIKYSVSPNPSEGIFTVELQTAEKITFSIYDASGKCVSSGFFRGGVQEVSLCNWPAGVYVLELSGESQVQRERIVKL